MVRKAFDVVNKRVQNIFFWSFRVWQVVELAATMATACCQNAGPGNGHLVSAWSMVLRHLKNSEILVGCCWVVIELENELTFKAVLVLASSATVDRG